ncbi:hypothetical protein KUTeg_004479 [Tegillarca granosa]|uniref:Palmitoyltransferase n=1 Tax=Tegillarca granosa TaxID=220873 RepID=A0ABQ9FQ60_TEGGR|nr:hypothetical protein KUTeg_004479 [Tegillarca granosa]
MQLMFVLIVLLGHAVFLFDMLPILYKYEFEKNHVVFPMFVAFTNFFFFHMSCTADPGEITPSNLEKYSDIYKFDYKLYYPKTFCRTCHFMKPARSKHCSICDRCVYRFDHHCIWTNNDVGGLNVRYFIMFLLTLVFMAANGVYVASHCLFLYVEKHDIMKASVLLNSGEIQPVTFQIAFQHMFIQFPRLVFLVVSLILVIPMIGTFTAYHLFLIFTNQTTNERYKTIEIKDNEQDHSNSVKGRQPLTECNIKSRIISGRKSKATKYRPYNYGIFSNLLEIFLMYNLKNKKKQR